MAREVLRTVEGGVPEAEPQMRYTGFGPSSIQFNVVLRANDLPATHVVRHEFVKRLLARYRQEGIVIPYPIRTLDLPPGGAPELRGAVRDS